MQTLQAAQPLSIEPIAGEPARFLVSSRSGNLPYLVDIEENGGRGFCGCHHHEFRVQPKIERGEPAEPCAHVQAVLNWIERN